MLLKISLLIVGLFFMPSYATENSLTWDLRCNTRKNVTQAIGTNFSATIISHCSNNPTHRCFMKYIFEASDNLSDVTNIQINEDGNVADPKPVSLKNRATFRLEFRKLDEPNRIIVNLTVVPSNQPLAVNLGMQGYKYGDSCSGSTGAFTYATVNFEGCQNISEFSVVMPSSDIAQYLDYGRIVCNNHGTGRAIFSNGSEAFETQCSADAKWKYKDDISCLYPIIAKLRIDGQRYSSTVELNHTHSYESNEVSLNCTFRDADNGINSPTFQVGNHKVNKSFLTITPEHNGIKVSCYVENNYTRRFNEPHLSTSTLDIKFGPYKPPGYSSLCSSSNGSILFYSNPKSTRDKLALVARRNISQYSGPPGDEIPTVIEDCCENNYQVQGQMITPTVNTSLPLSNRSNWCLRSNYSGTNEYYRVELCENIKIKIETITPDEKAATSTETNKSSSNLIIISASVGGLTLLLAILAGCLCWRRHHKGKSEIIDAGKVENVNPLYGTSENLFADTSTKNEIINTLYGTAQSVEDGAELHSVVDIENNDNGKNKLQTGISLDNVYAVIQKEEEKSKGQDNSGFVAIDQGESTYAVVNNKEIMKGHESSDSVGPDQGESTYSVINKKQKKIDQEKRVSVDTYSLVDNKQKKTGNKNFIPMSESNLDTYAVVDRSIKRNKKGAQNSNPSNTSEIDIYASVD